MSSTPHSIIPTPSSAEDCVLPQCTRISSALGEAGVRALILG